jgi:hypothetical protein
MAAGIGLDGLALTSSVLHRFIEVEEITFRHPQITALGKTGLRWSRPDAIEQPQRKFLFQRFDLQRGSGLRHIQVFSDLPKLGVRRPGIL